MSGRSAEQGHDDIRVSYPLTGGLQLIIAMYPGSFDPLTRGHLDITRRAAALFDKVVLGVYDRPHKKLMFSAEERVQLARESTAHMPNVEVMSYSTLTIEFARQIGARVIVRGLRMSPDFEREFEMALMNRKLAPDLDLVCFMASIEYQFLSSSLLKEVALLGGNLEHMVPENVAAALKKKLA